MRRLAAILTTLALAAGALAQDGTLTPYTPEYTVARLELQVGLLCPDAKYRSGEPGVRYVDPAPYTLHLDGRALPACSAVLYLDAPGLTPAVDDAVTFVQGLRRRATALGGTFDEVAVYPGEGALLTPWTAGDPFLFRIVTGPAGPTVMRAIVAVGVYGDRATGEVGAIITAHPF